MFQFANLLGKPGKGVYLLKKSAKAYRSNQPWWKYELEVEPEEYVLSTLRYKNSQNKYFEDAVEELDHAKEEMKEEEEFE